MSQFDSIIGLGIAVMESETGVPVTRGAVTRLGIPSSYRKTYTDDKTGFLAQSDGYVTLRSQYIADLGLVIRAVFTMNGETLRVVSIDLDGARPADVHYSKDV